MAGHKEHAELLADLRALIEQARKRVAQAIGTEEAPMRYMLGEKYLAAINRLASSENAKTVLLPADIQETIKGLLGKKV